MRNRIDNAGRRAYQIGNMFMIANHFNRQSYAKGRVQADLTPAPGRAPRARNGPR